MSSSTTVTELCLQLRLALESPSDALPAKDLNERVETFAKERPDATLLQQLEDELQAIYDDVLGHFIISQAEIFLAFIYHLRTVLPSCSIISTWFDLVLRPTLREPKLSPPAVEHAKGLILTALDPDRNLIDVEDGSVDIEKRKERVGDFRRRLMDFYLLDAFNESSGDDVLEWADLSPEEREKKGCWKANLEDILVRVGLERPNDFLTELYRCFDSPTTRLQLLILLNAYTSQSAFPERANALASHPLMNSLLYCLIFDTSSTACTIALTILTKLLPVFAVHTCDQLKRLLPLLLVVLARLLCWKERLSSQPMWPVFHDHDNLEEIPPESDEEHVAKDDEISTLPMREDLEWNPLLFTFEGPQSKAPSTHRYFTFLYYLFPCNVIRFLRYPVRYLNDNELETLYAVEWENALDEVKIRSKSERLLRMHVLHPLLVWREASEELERPDFWAKYDIHQIVGGATMLDVRNAGLGVKQHSQETQSRAAGPHPTSPVDRRRYSRPSSVVEISSSMVVEEVPPDIAAEDAVLLSSSLETVHPAAETPAVADPVRLKVSLTDMIATSVALRSGLDVEIVDASPSWTSVLFPSQPRTRSPSRNDRESSQPPEETGEPPGTLSQPEAEYLVHSPVPRHVVEAISNLQREVLLLKNDLNLELWTARENVKHIGRLYKERVLSRNEELERQGLHNTLREYKHQVTGLRQELKVEKEQAVAQRMRYTDWNKELQERITVLRGEKKTWMSEAAAMRAAEKEARDTFAAQGKLLAEATNAVFSLKTQIKENAPKVDRLHDYEIQIEQLMKLQRLWESDVQKLNDSKEYLAAFASKYKKMELSVEAHEKALLEMEEGAAAQRQRILVLESKVEHYKKRLETARRGSVNGQTELPAEWRRVQAANERLRRENEELREEIEEVKVMLEFLKAQRSGRTGLIDSPRSSPPI
ncbi:hypothetical protein C8Q80DRAFT_1219448 [Daedaleopsis nitida]|nr:hypothetical protein C8Q80DRAFT_1219448 [Daedaleopsis nitida]